MVLVTVWVALILVMIDSKAKMKTYTGPQNTLLHEAMKKRDEPDGDYILTLTGTHCGPFWVSLRP